MFGSKYHMGGGFDSICLVLSGGFLCIVMSCRDVTELRLNRWIPRREEEKAKTMQEVRMVDVVVAAIAIVVISSWR